MDLYQQRRKHSNPCFGKSSFLATKDLLCQHVCTLDDILFKKICLQTQDHKNTTTEGRGMLQWHQYMSSEGDAVHHPYFLPCPAPPSSQVGELLHPIRLGRQDISAICWLASFSASSVYFTCNASGPARSYSAFYASKAYMGQDQGLQNSAPGPEMACNQSLTSPQPASNPVDQTELKL